MSRFHDVVRLHASLVVAMLLLGASVPAAAQGGRGRGMMGGGMMNDPAHQADMQQFHFLLDNGARINRVVTVRPDGVESVTESYDPTVAKTIQEHVSSMSARVKEAPGLASREREAHVGIDGRRYEDHRVEAIQDAAVTGYQTRAVLGAHGALDQ